jgi:anti-sigma regulatory factor (Ser/Thr protein kinase)
LTLRLAASEAVHRARGLPFSIVPPRQAAVRAYLSRAGLAHSMGLPEQSQQTDVLVPATRISKSSGVEPVGEELASAANALPPALTSTADALVLALSELGGNACSHGKSEHGAFVLAQRFGSKRLVLAVGDLGMGIPDHLSQALPPANRLNKESQVIAHALQRGVSGVPNGDGRGNGLPRTLQTIREVGMPVADLSIWSGAGRVSVQMRPGLRRRVADVTSYTTGAWIEVVLASSASG